jgi:uncharacterized membrane protein YphA (DoxX/SURF4 family)
MSMLDGRIAPLRAAMVRDPDGHVLQLEDSDNGQLYQQDSRDTDACFSHVEDVAMAMIARLMPIARDTMSFAERSFGPLLDLFIRLWLAQSFFVSGLVKAANWNTALLLATYEYPVSWLDPHTSAATGLAIELICPPLIALGLFTRIAAIPLLILSLVIQFAYKPLPENLFWALLFGLMILRGPGALSLDRLLGPAVLSSALPFAGTARRVLKTVKLQFEGRSLRDLPIKAIYNGERPLCGHTSAGVLVYYER